MALGTQPEADVEGSEDSLFADINITPLTDIFLVLLVIFMVTAGKAIDDTQRAKAEKEEVVEKVTADKRMGLKVNLPSGAAQEIDIKGKSLIIAISKGGEIAVNDTKISASDLETVFESAHGLDPDTQVVIKADKGVDHGTVVGVMERAKSVGLTRLAIQTRGD